jgi:hypothetical protein
MPLIGTRVVRKDDGTIENTGEWIELTNEARRQSVYIVGNTGVGKTTLLKSIAYQDILAGEGVCVIDPHGDLVDELLELIPADRKDDVLLFAPGDRDQRGKPIGLNLFDCDRSDEEQTQRVTSTVISTLYRLFSYSWGPRMEDLLRASTLTLMETPGTSLLDLSLLLTSKRHRRGYTQVLTDYYLRQYWAVQFKGYTENPRDLLDLIGSSLNKISRFLSDKRVRRVIVQPKTAFSLREIMDKRKIFLVKLAKSQLGEDNSALFGSVLVNLFLVAALSRSDTPKNERVPFHLIVDEFQTFADADTFAVLQSELRKYNLDSVVAHQFRGQLDELNQNSTMAVANFMVMRVSGRDAQEVTMQFDNTPPPPDPMWEAVRRPYSDPQFAGLYAPDNSFQYPVPGPRRPFMDVAAEHANVISNLSNYWAKSRLLDGKQFKEYFVEVVPPEQLPIEHRLGDGAAQRAIAEYIRLKSLELGMAADEVDKLVKRKIGEIVDFDDYPGAPVRPVEEETEE